VAPRKIRRAGAGDAPRLAALSDQLGYPSREEDVQRRLEAVLGRGDHAVLVAENEGEIVGWIHVFRADRIEANPFAEIGGLVIDEVWRGHRLGTTLLAATEAWAVEQDLPSMRIRSNVMREETHFFYEKQGYENRKLQSVFVKPLGVKVL